MRLTMGVEEEFLLLDSEGATVPLAGPVVDAACRRTNLPKGCVVKRELRPSQVELTSSICTDAAELRDQLGIGRSVLAECAEAAGARLISVGVPPLPSLPSSTSTLVLMPREQRSMELSATERRYAEVGTLYAGVADRYEACGCHVHIGVPDRETAIRVCNLVRPWLPTLLALSANSPIEQGIDTGYDSWRMIEQSRFPGAGIPPGFDSYADQQAEIRRLVGAGILIDDRMCFWLVRPSPHLQTVEFRVADAGATVTDSTLQAVLCRALVATVIAGTTTTTSLVDDPQAAAAAMWTAARYGLRGQGVDLVDATLRPAITLADDLLRHVHEALRGAGDDAWARSTLTDMLRHGTGAERQRRSFRDGRQGLLSHLTEELTRAPAFVEEVSDHEEEVST